MQYRYAAGTGIVDIGTGVFDEAATACCEALAASLSLSPGLYRNPKGVCPVGGEVFTTTTLRGLCRIAQNLEPGGSASEDPLGELKAGEPACRAYIEALLDGSEEPVFYALDGYLIRRPYEEL